MKLRANRLRRLVAGSITIAVSIVVAIAPTTASAAPPPVPTGVSATAMNSYAIRVAWTDTSGGAAQFTVQSGSATSRTLPAGTSSFIWSAVNPNTSLCFTVTAITSGGSSAASAQACATTTSAVCQSTLNMADASGNIDFYHGTSLSSAESIRDSGIDLNAGDLNRDFGKGFYVTTLLFQAQEWARQNFPGQTPSVVHFRIQASQMASLCGLVFPGPTDDWLGLVSFNLTTPPATGGAGYDFVEGPLMRNIGGYLAGQPVKWSGQQDSFHTPRGAALLDNGFVEIMSASPAKVMVVGDSISQGSAGDFTWRYRFYKQEIAAGVNLAMAGPRTDLFDNVANTWDDNHTYVDPNFDQRHDAIWGRSLQGAAADIQAEVSANQPEYLLVLLGINDLGFGISDPAGTEASLKSFVANARAASPDIRLVFNLLLPTQRAQTDSNFAAMVADYNARLANDAVALTTPQSPMIIATGGQDIDPVADLWDGTHPNARGEVKIAASFVDALATGFGDDDHSPGFGVPYPRPYPVVPLGPQTSPVLSASPGDGQATLSWTLAPGATGYFVYLKNVSRHETTFTKLPYPVPGSSWVAQLLVNGDQYQFQLGTTKGNTEGVLSTVATVTPNGPAPAGVTDLSAAPGNGQATLSWTPVAHATGYFVFLKDLTQHATSFQELPYPVPGPSWTAGLLINGDTYQFELQSVDGDVMGGMSNVASAQVAGPAPVGTTLSASAGDGQATLSWTPVANATGFLVYMRNVTRHEASFTQLPYPVSGTSWVAGDLINGDAYQFELKSMNGDQPGGMSNVASVTPAGPAPIGVTLSATGGDGQVTLSWSPVAHATGYFVYLKDVSREQTAFQKLPYQVSGSSWVAGDLINGDTYQFQLQSMSGDQAGGFSNVASATAAGPVPAGVTDLSAAPGDGQVTLSWTPVAHATGYFVYLENATRGGGFTRLPYAVAGPSWTAGLLLNGDSYKFQLQSLNGDEGGGYSNIASATPAGPTPGGVTDLAAAAGDGRATLSWTPVAHATGYFVFLENVTRNDASFKKLPYQVSGSSWVAAGLINGDTYQFQLQSMNDDQPGGFSNIASATPTGPAPAGVTDLIAGTFGSFGSNQVELSWTPVAHATSYYIYYRDLTTGDQQFTRLPIPVGGSSWIAGDLALASTYQFQLQSMNGDQPGGFSNVAQVYIPPSTWPAMDILSIRGATNCVPAVGGGYLCYQDADAAIIATRSPDGTTITIDQSWSTNGYHLDDGMFRYQLWDVTTGGANPAWEFIAQYDTGTNLTAWQQESAVNVDPGHQYSIRVFGAGDLATRPQETHFSVSFNPSIPSFDSGYSAPL